MGAWWIRVRVRGGCGSVWHGISGVMLMCGGRGWVAGWVDNSWVGDSGGTWICGTRVVVGGCGRWLSDVSSAPGRWRPKRRK